MKEKKLLFILSFLLILLNTVLYSKNNDSNQNIYPLRVGVPNIQTKSMTNGNLWLTFSNFGLLGNAGKWNTEQYSCMFPGNSGIEYLYQGALWIGAIVGNDTLCTVGIDGWLQEKEMYPGVDPDDSIIERSVIPSSPIFDTNAIAGLDFISVYSDTYTDQWQCPNLGNFHQSLGLEITQKSYSVFLSDSSSNASTQPFFHEDYIIVDFIIKNIGQNILKEVYIGLYIDGDCGPTGELYEQNKCQDDVCGFIPNIRTQYGGNPNNPKDSVNIAWIAESRLTGFVGNCLGIETPDVTGIMVLRTPNPNCRTSFNWWFGNQNDQTLDWGPTFPNNPFDILLNEINSQLAPGDLQAGTPSYDDPRADIMKWLYLANGSYDPDQIDIQCAGRDTLINDTRYLISFGPIFLSKRNGIPVIDSSFYPGDSVILSIAYIGGEDFQTNNDLPLWSNHPFVPPGDTVIPYDTLSNGNIVPDYSYSWSAVRYDFTDLVKNAKLALDVYDNPKIITPVLWGDDTITQSIVSYLLLSDTIICDTLDPYFHWPVPIVVNGDTIDWTGDGIPDYNGVPVPPYSYNNDNNIIIDYLISERDKGSIDFKFNLISAGNVNLTIYDLSGRLIISPISKHFPIGENSISYNLNRRGLFFYKIEYNNIIQKGKIIIN